MVSVTKKSEFPTVPHFAILEFTSVGHEADERSKTHPGHGYPAYSEDVCHYYAFTDRNEWIAEIRRRAENDRRDPWGWQWVAFEAGKPVGISVKIDVGDELHGSM